MMPTSPEGNGCVPGFNGFFIIDSQGVIIFHLFGVYERYKLFGLNLFFFCFMLVSIAEVCFVSALQVLEVPTGKVLATLLGHTKTVFWCQFSQDGQKLITSSEDTTIRVGSPHSSFLHSSPSPIDFSSPVPIPHVSKTT